MLTPFFAENNRTKIAGFGLLAAAVLSVGCAKPMAETANAPALTGLANPVTAKITHKHKVSPPPTALLPKTLPKKPKDRLSRLVRVPPARVGKVVTLRIAPPVGYHINADGPSWLALYDTGADSKRIFAVRRDAILSGVLVLPALADGHSYRLQGTLFYCANAAGACLLQSHDQELVADSRDSSDLGIALRAP